MLRTAEPLRLNPATLNAFSKHIGKAEAEMSQTLHGEREFLWSDCSAERAERLRRERTIAQLYSHDHPVEVPYGLIHDWIGATCIPNTTLGKTLTLIQDYDNHKHLYKPEVVDSVARSMHMPSHLPQIRSPILLPLPECPFGHTRKRSSTIFCLLQGLARDSNR